MKAKTISTLITAVLVLMVVAVALFSSFYTIENGQAVVIQRFGEHVATNTTPGINFKIPFIDSHTVVDVNSVYRMEFGFETLDGGEYVDDFEESLMLTGDENLAIVETIVQYQIKDAAMYLFSVDDLYDTFSIVAQSTIRRVIASHTLDDAMTDNKMMIQQEIWDDLQAVMDKYESGIRITGVQLQDVNPPLEVDAAFKDVAGAREDKTSYINEAVAYSNEIIPDARGKAATMVNEAKAYKTRRIEEAKGEVAAYNLLYQEYINEPETTRTRLYLEAMEDILPGVTKYIMSSEDSVKLFNLD